MGKLRRWHCEHGHGEVLTVATLRQVIQPERFKAWWADAHAASGTGLSCASCAAPSTSVQHQTDKGVLELDLCRRCRLVWLDQGERTELGPAELPPAPGPDPSLSPEAREALLRMELERIHSDTERRFADSGDALSPVGRSDWWDLGAAMGEQGAPPVHQPPIVSWITLVALILGFFVSLGLGGEGVDHWGLWLDAPLREHGLTLVASTVIAPNPMYVFAAGWVVWFMADNVEDVLGSPLFGGLMVAAQVLVVLAQAVVVGLESPPVIGMAGPVSAVAVYYALRFPKVRFRSRSRSGSVHHLSAGWMALIMLGLLFAGAVNEYGDATTTWLGPLVGGGLGLGMWGVTGMELGQGGGEPLL
jgi:membrane associated rhomboid family serine protease/Zn-finger nucleic acid-binding protein